MAHVNLNLNGLTISLSPQLHGWFHQSREHGQVSFYLLLPVIPLNTVVYLSLSVSHTHTHILQHFIGMAWSKMKRTRSEVMAILHNIQQMTWLLRLNLERSFNRKSPSTVGAEIEREQGDRSVPWISKGDKEQTTPILILWRIKSAPMWSQPHCDSFSELRSDLEFHSKKSSQKGCYLHVSQKLASSYHHVQTHMPPEWPSYKGSQLFHSAQLQGHPEGTLDEKLKLWVISSQIHFTCFHYSSSF